ncbi:hypothetical protein HDV00_012751, partial [Rhizophlyctis rosea]
LSQIADKARPDAKDVKYLYGYMGLAIDGLLYWLLRGDAANILHQNYEGIEDPYIKDGNIYVQDSNKMGRAYFTPMPTIMLPIIDKKIARSAKLGYDRLFAPQKKKCKVIPSHKLMQSRIKPIGEESFGGRKLTTNLIRKAVATADYQRWKKRGGTINELFQMAGRLDHDLRTHLLTYVHEEMNDPQCLDQASFGDTNFEELQYEEVTVASAATQEPKAMDVDA